MRKWIIFLWLFAAVLPAGTTMIRTATFNCSLTRSKAGGLIEDLRGGQNPQGKAVAEILQRVRPDVVLLNEFDWDAEGRGIGIFQKEYLEISQSGQEPLVYPFVFTGPVNTGLASGIDLDGDGRTDGPEDAFGYGRFEGQYGMVLLSRFPIRKETVRTFQTFLWKDMPGALLPKKPGAEKELWYSPEALERLRLSSKSHWDVPVEVHGRVIHFLASHPTPPVFDGAEDRNGRRNHDEIRFWADYLTKDKSGYIYDDAGRRGGLEEGALFVILGDLNADPLDGDGLHEGILSLLNHPRVQDVRPASKGAAEAARLDGGVNERHKGPAELDTYQSSPGRQPGNLRLDYVLPCREWKVIKAEVFWPERAEPLARLTAGPPYVSSDHRLVWADLELP
ncbi:MAG TPA: endonuclease/exonuclease/phosphatase family protein [Anaerohalosphaeraceae bacterium]|nr:endonuclease/exonuclease/phosphatase family protein [Anaerohalosphaeraceae bacterium]